MDFLNAYTYGFCEKRGFTRGTAWKHSLRLLAESTGCNAIILPVCAWQEHTYSTVMDSAHPDVMDGEDVRNVCGFAEELGLKVILKAMVNCRDGYWRAYIRFFDTEVPVEPGWAEWFASWSEHVKRVAAMAEENRAEIYCIGCEMVGTDHREQEWRKLIAEVREIYHGKLTYNCDKYQEEHVSSRGFRRWRSGRTGRSCSWNADAPPGTAASCGRMTGGSERASARRPRQSGTGPSWRRWSASPSSGEPDGGTGRRPGCIRSSPGRIRTATARGASRPTG